MKNQSTIRLSRRERQIMDILYRRKRATAGEVHQAMPDPPSYSAVRATLRIMEEKGHVRHESGSLPYLYSPTVAPDQARSSALRHMLDTFFNGSVEQVVSTLIAESEGALSLEELDRLGTLIDQARRKGR